MSVPLEHNNILVTGGTGFVGSYILRYLLKKGYTCISATRRPSSRMEMLSDIEKKITWIECDLFDFEKLSESMNSIDAIIHSAAMISFVPSDINLLYKVNVIGTANLINAALQNNVKKFVHISSVAAFGRSTRQSVISESTSFIRSHLNTNYGISKHHAEQEVWRGQAEGLDTYILNPAMIMGAGYWDTGTCRLVSRIASGLKVYPTGKSGYVDVRDVAKMSIQLLENEYESKQFLCSGKSMSIQSMIHLIAEHLNVDPPKFKLNPTMAEFAWRWVALTSQFSGKKPLITKETIRTAQQEFTFDNSRSLEELNYQYINLENTIEQTCKLFLSDQNNKNPYNILPLI